MRNLNKEIKAIEGANTKGLIKAAKIIKRDMESTPPLTPVDTGNLRSSLFIVTADKVEEGSSPKFVGRTSSEKRKAAVMQGEHNSIVSTYKEQARAAKKQIVYMGYTANYAQAVHEKSSRTNWKRRGAGAKWFQEAVSRNHNLILQTIKNNVKNK